MITILIADDHTLVRTGLRLLVEQFEDMKVVGEASDGAGALAKVEELRPDVVLMDLGMPGLHGLEAIARAGRSAQPPRILVLSMHENEAYVAAALRDGARGYVLKGSESEELERAIRAVHRGETWISPHLSRTAITALRREDSSEPLTLLTSRQREVLQLLAEGARTRAIAGRLGISPKTVEAHRASIMDRLGIHDIPGLVRFAIRVGLIVEPR